MFMRFHGVFLGNQHELWSKQHNGKVSIFSLIISRTMAARVPFDGEQCYVQVYTMVRIKKDSGTPWFFERFGVCESLIPACRILPPNRYLRQNTHILGGTPRDMHMETA